MTIASWIYKKTWYIQFQMMAPESWKNGKIKNCKYINNQEVGNIIQDFSCKSFLRRCNLKTKLNTLQKMTMFFVAMLTITSAYGTTKNLLQNAGFEEQSPKTKFPMFYSRWKIFLRQHKTCLKPTRNYSLINQ